MHPAVKAAQVGICLVGYVVVAGLAWGVIADRQHNDSQERKPLAAETPAGSAASSGLEGAQQTGKLKLVNQTAVTRSRVTVSACEPRPVGTVIFRPDGVATHMCRCVPVRPKQRRQRPDTKPGHNLFTSASLRSEGAHDTVEAD